MSDALNECTVVELRQRLRAGEICARDIVLSVEAAIAARDEVSGGSLHRDVERALEALALDVVLTNLPPARDAASHWLIHRIDEQPVSLIGTPGRVGSGRGLAELLAASPRGGGHQDGFQADRAAHRAAGHPGQPAAAAQPQAHPSAGGGMSGSRAFGPLLALLPLQPGEALLKHNHGVSGVLPQLLQQPSGGHQDLGVRVSHGCE